MPSEFEKWVDAKTIRELVKHTVTCGACLLLATPLKLLLDHVSQWSRFPNVVEQAVEWIEYGYLLLVLVIFAVATVRSIWKGMFDE
jgi:hypothetical protein